MLWLCSITANHPARRSDHRTLSSASIDRKTKARRVNQAGKAGSKRTKDVGHGFHQVPLGFAVTVGHSFLLSQHKTAQDCVGLIQEEVKHLHAGGDALRQRAADDCVVGTHCFQDDAHITDGAPLHGKACEQQRQWVRSSEE